MAGFANTRLQSSMLFRFAVYTEQIITRLFPAKDIKMKSRFAALFLWAQFCGVAFASDAPWYVWVNTTDGTTLCAQVSPDDTWAIFKGPFSESHCRKPGNPQ